MLPDYFYTACIPDGLQLYMKVSDCLDRYSSQTVHRIRTLSWERILFLSAVFYTEESVSARWLLSLWLWLASCSLHPGTHSLSGCRIFPAVFCTLQRMNISCYCLKAQYKAVSVAEGLLLICKAFFMFSLVIVA